MNNLKYPSWNCMAYWGLLILTWPCIDIISWMLLYLLSRMKVWGRRNPICHVKRRLELVHLTSSPKAKEKRKDFSDTYYYRLFVSKKEKDYESIDAQCIWQSWKVKIQSICTVKYKKFIMPLEYYIQPLNIVLKKSTYMFKNMLLSLGS